MRIHHNSQFERLLLGYVDMPSINPSIIPESDLLQWSPNPYCIRHVFLPSASNSFSKPGWAQTKPCYGYVESFNNSLLFSEKPNYFVMTHIFYFYSIFFTSDLLVLTFWVRGLWARVIPFYAVWTRGSGVGQAFYRLPYIPCLCLLKNRFLFSTPASSATSNRTTSGSLAVVFPLVFQYYNKIPKPG